ncbi:MAG: VirB3 family type IV secretion system protein [Parasutterella sp.]
MGAVLVAASSGWPICWWAKWTTSSPLFKGATRPACVGGVPLKVFVLNIGVIALLAIWMWTPLILIAPITHFYLKSVADKDEQIFPSCSPTFASISFKPKTASFGETSQV